MAIAQNGAITAYYWDVAKLLSMGVKEQLVSRMSPKQARDMLKGLLYLHESHKDHVHSSFAFAAAGTRLTE